MTAGMILVAGQLVLFSRLGVDATFWNLLPALMIGGIGMALTMTPSAAAATRSVPVDKAGVGSAVLNCARQIGGTMGIAVMGAIMASQTGGVRSVDAFMNGFQSALPSQQESRSRAQSSRSRSSAHTKAPANHVRVPAAPEPVA